MIAAVLLLGIAPASGFGAMLGFFVPFGFGLTALFYTKVVEEFGNTLRRFLIHMSGPLFVLMYIMGYAGVWNSDRFNWTAFMCIAGAFILNHPHWGNFKRWR